MPGLPAGADPGWQCCAEGSGGAMWGSDSEDCALGVGGVFSEGLGRISGVLLSVTAVSSQHSEVSPRLLRDVPGQRWWRGDGCEPPLSSVGLWAHPAPQTAVWRASGSDCTLPCSWKLCTDTASGTDCTVHACHTRRDKGAVAELAHAKDRLPCPPRPPAAAMLTQR